MSWILFLSPLDLGSPRFVRLSHLDLSPYAVFPDFICPSSPSRRSFFIANQCPDFFRLYASSPYILFLAFSVFCFCLLPRGWLPPVCLSTVSATRFQVQPQSRHYSCGGLRCLPARHAFVCFFILLFLRLRRTCCQRVLSRHQLHFLFCCPDCECGLERQSTNGECFFTASL